MTGFQRLSVPLALAAALTSAVAAPKGESIARGRAVFDEKGCQQCHSYVSRRSAPSVRDLLREFIGEPVKVSEAINKSPAHQDELRSGKVSTRDVRAISEWLAGDFWPDEEEPGATEPAKATTQGGIATAVPVPPVNQAAPAAPGGGEPAVTTRPQATIAPAAAAPVPPATVATMPLSGPTVTRIRVQAEKSGTDRVILDLAGGEPDAIDMQTINGELVIRLTGAALANSVAQQLTPAESTSVLGSVRTTAHQRVIEIAVVPRVVDWTYTAVQGRTRLTVDLTVAPRKASVAGKGVAKGMADNQAAKTEKQAKAEKPVKQEKVDKPAKVAKADKATAAAAVNTASPAAATTAASGVATAGARAAQDGAKAVASASARTEVKPPVTVARAEPDVAVAAPARRDAEAARARDVTVQASAKRDVDTDAGWQAAETAAAGKAQRRGAKRPYKEPKLDPCPPANPADQVIGVVDVERAKEIIDRVGCPQCHAYVQKKTGPPFREVLKKYSGDPACVIHRLKTNETHRDEGVTRDIRPGEFKIIADYVATRVKKD